MSTARPTRRDVSVRRQLAEAQLRIRRLERIGDLRDFAARSAYPAAATFMHLADLLTHHERGFPNVRAPRW